MKEVLHIVCLDNPYPPDYGGAIDMYEKIRALSLTGKKIILHYFQYNKRYKLGDLEKYCIAIHSYKRKNILSGPFLLPYIIGSRINKKLIENLNKDDNPILLEGFHCSGILPYLNNQGRALIRVHNIESVYYRNLAGIERAFVRKYYMQRESKLLERYMNNLDKNVSLACISDTDKNQLIEKSGFSNCSYIPAFVSWQRPLIKTGQGSYCLFHGNFYVAENLTCAEWLLENVIPKLKMPFYFAGKLPQKLISLAKDVKNSVLFSSPDHNTLENMISEAHIHFIPDRLHTGIKIKLIHALFCGRHIVCNIPLYNDENAGIYQYTNATQLCDQINSLMGIKFTEENKKNRLHYLKPFDNNINAEKLNALW